MDAGVMMLSLLAGFVGAAAGALLMIGRLKQQHARLLETVELRLNDSSRDAKLGQLLETVDKRLNDAASLVPQRKIPATNLPLADGSAPAGDASAANRGVVPTRGFGDAKP